MNYLLTQFSSKKSGTTRELSIKRRMKKIKKKPQLNWLVDDKFGGNIIKVYRVCLHSSAKLIEPVLAGRWTRPFIRASTHLIFLSRHPLVPFVPFDDSFTRFLTFRPTGICQSEISLLRASAPWPIRLSASRKLGELLFLHIGIIAELKLVILKKNRISFGTVVTLLHHRAGVNLIYLHPFFILDFVKII